MTSANEGLKPTNPAHKLTRRELAAAVGASSAFATAVAMVSLPAVALVVEKGANLVDRMIHPDRKSKHLKLFAEAISEGGPFQFLEGPLTFVTPTEGIMLRTAPEIHKDFETSVMLDGINTIFGGILAKGGKSGNPDEPDSDDWLAILHQGQFHFIPPHQLGIRDIFQTLAHQTRPVNLYGRSWDNNALIGEGGEAIAVVLRHPDQTA